MATQIANYQCPACMGPLQFDPTTGKLTCEYCGSDYAIEQIETAYEGKEAAAADAMAEADAKREAEEARRAEAEAEAAAAGWDTSGLNDGWGQEAAGMRLYNCPSCGAELICEETTAATACPYCGNPSIIPGQFSGVLKPDFVLPFKLKKEDAVQKLKEHYKGRPLLPKQFCEENHLQEIKGVYVPFWLFDGKAEGEATYRASITHVSRSGDYQITRTQHFHVRRDGSVTFEKIPVDGSKKMPDDYMDSLEPFNYSELKEFSTAYLPGYLADKYDMSAEDCSSRADLRAKTTLAESLRDSVVGYSGVVETGKQLRLKRGKVSYALLPVWLLNTKWDGKDYLFAMNGQTGKFVGDLPIDRKKKRRIFGAVYAIAAAVTALLVLFPGGLLKLLGG